MDLTEEGMGARGGDLVIEVKVWDDIIPSSKGAEHETVHRGHTHGFGNSEERAIRSNLGVSGRPGDVGWDNAAGTGRVVPHLGVYHDAATAKGNTVCLRLHNVFGGRAPGACAALRRLARRDAYDRTDYPTRGHTFEAHEHFQTYWGQRLSAAAAFGDARRSLRRLAKLRGEAARGAAARTPLRASPAHRA